MGVERETWRSIPLYYAIIDELERRGGSAKDVELYASLRERFQNITFSDFLKALMVLEMQDIIHVTMIRDDLRNIELLRKP